MTQIIFQAIVACCCIYTAYRLSLFIFRRLFKGRKSGKDVRDVSVETADITRHDNGDDDTSEITFEVLENTSAFKSSETGSYKSSYLVSYPVGNRIQVYINRESYAYIKRFLAVTAPEMPISGFVNSELSHITFTDCDFVCSGRGKVTEAQDENGHWDNRTGDSLFVIRKAKDVRSRNCDFSFTPESENYDYDASTENCENIQFYNCLHSKGVKDN